MHRTSAVRGPSAARRPSAVRRTILLLTALLLSLQLLAACSKAEPNPAPPPVTPPDQPLPPREGPAVTEPVHYDLVIRGGILLDGSGGAPVRGDIGLIGDRIAAVGRLAPYTAGRAIDATGLYVAPGFINPHSHTHDFINPFEDLDAVASLRQGITTEFGGVDGRSPLPIGAELERLSASGTGVNFGLFVGQGSVRGQVMGNAWGAANAEQLTQMREIVRQAMGEGAFGLSSGLEYAPGRGADQAEIIALAAETRAYGGVYSTHMRSEGAGILQALQEALAIGKAAGVPVNLSHFKIVRPENWHVEEQLVQLIEQAIREGQKVFADVYPYLAPDYAVNRPLAEWRSSLPPQYLLITRATDPSVVGKSLAEVARALGLEPQAAADRLLAADPNTAVVALISSEQAMIRFLKADWSVVSTDGESQPRLSSPEEALRLALHRRSYGSYPQLLGHYVRERSLLPLEAMIRKMSGAVADHLGLKNRGYLRAGYYADIVVFDPKTVADRTTWLQPQEYPDGIYHVLINGAIAVEHGQWTGQRYGRVLRRGED